MKILEFLFIFLLISMPSFADSNNIRYVALGDSYTIGTGVDPDQSWPSVMTESLQSKNIVIQLVGNLAQNGRTSRHVIDYQLPQLKNLRPDMVSVLIGVNDWVQGVGPNIFENNIKSILDQLIDIIPNKKNIIVITIPDFSVTPTGGEYSRGRNASKGIDEFNQIIKDQAALRGIKTIDLYPLSRKMKDDLSLVCPDGLHPSVKGYAQWANYIESQLEISQ